VASGRAMSSGLRDTSYEPLPTSRPGVKKFMAGCNVLKTRNTTVAEGNEETQETGLRLKDSLAHHPLEAAARSSAVTRYPRTQPISPGMPPEARLLSTLVFLHHQSRQLLCDINFEHLGRRQFRYRSLAPPFSSAAPVCALKVR